MTKIALIDLDGTLADYHSRIEEDLRSLMSPGEEWVSEIHNVVIGKEYINKRKTLITKQEGWWRNLKQYKPGMDVLEIIINLGFKIEILTKAPLHKSNTWKEKIEWCGKNLKCEYGVTITQNKSLVNGDILMDDYPNYVLPWLKVRPNGFVIMPEHDYNKDFKHPRVYKYTGNKEEVAILLKKIYNNETI